MLRTCVATGTEGAGRVADAADPAGRRAVLYRRHPPEQQLSEGSLDSLHAAGEHRDHIKADPIGLHLARSKPSGRRSTRSRLSTTSAGRPWASEMRSFTSQRTTSPSHRTIRSISPTGQHQLRASTRSPSQIYRRSTTCHPRRPTPEGTKDPADGAGDPVFHVVATTATLGMRCDGGPKRAGRCGIRNPASP